ncbi:archaellar assembly protein FlaJ [Pyrococcus abyssi]|uniref:Flagellar assembly protein J n=1 Tax=Pyrococcus abyssi (strain GE5 / Orsay) TaxID=272844 RepID=G8ZIQ5_PYRAB|nr:archaellar assembly protein FlaJ [Pyrococcus abyssi]CCE70938.1 TPA: flagellar assembly protein J [Pyrococcus abyssi GE5]
MPQEKISIFVKADLDPRTYLRRILLPGLLGSFVLFIVVSVFTRMIPLPRGLVFFMYLIPIIIAIYVAAYPYLAADSKRISINSKLPYFITYFAVLSTSEIGRTDILKVLASDPKLGAIAGEMKKVYMIVDKLHRSLPEAFRFLAKRTPSRVFADFLDRLAYSLDSGVELKDYLFQEQQTVMDDYQTFYEGALYDLDIFKEIYESIIISIVFAGAFMIIGPIITGQNIGRLALYLAFLILVAEIGSLMVIKYRMPEDPIWAEKRVETPRHRKIKRALIISSMLVPIVFLLYFILIRPRFKLPTPFVIALSLTPLAYAGNVVRKEEAMIFRKDENFPAFIRSLASSLASSGASLLLVLKYLSAHDFGTLTEDIRSLYRRLAVRVDTVRAWDFFIAETGSWLIGIFSEIFRESLRLGAEPDYVGKVISRNFERLVRLRRKRVQSVSNFIGIILGLTGAFAFSLAASFQVAVAINDIFSKFQVPTEYIGEIIHIIPPSGMKLLDLSLLLIMIVHSLLSALAIKVADGGNLLGSLYYFVILLWVFAFGMYIGQTLMARFMSVGEGGMILHLLGV